MQLALLSGVLSPNEHGIELSILSQTIYTQIDSMVTL